MTHYKIVPMEQCHVSGVAALEKRCFSAPWSVGSIASELDNPLSLWLVAVCDRTVLGYVGSQRVLDEADMMNLAVAEDARRQGIGKELVSVLIRALNASGVHCLTLEVRASNEGAKALYGGMGFQEIGRRPRYYFNPREDALILRKEWENDCFGC